MLSNLQWFPTTSARAKKDLLKNIIKTVSVGWLWEKNKYLLKNATQKQLAKICERLASEDCVDVPVQIKVQSTEKLSELRLAFSLLFNI